MHTSGVFNKGFCPETLLKDNNGGVAFILVIWILVALIAIVGEFTYSMRTELNIVRNFKEEEEAYQSALAGVEQAKLEILSAKKSTYVYLNEEGILIFKKEDTDEEEEEESPQRSGELGNSAFSYNITDEDGKLNINKAPLIQLKYIIENSGVDITEIDTVADSIFDWRDENDLHMLNGAEEDYYRSLDPPYSCKDGPFEAIDELLLVKGVTPEIFYGLESEDEDEEKIYEGIAQYFTVYDTERININTASREVLETVFGFEKAENIMIQRETGPIQKPISGGAVTSFFFTVTSTGTNPDGKIKRTVKTTLKKSDDKLEVIYWNDNFIG